MFYVFQRGAICRATVRARLVPGGNGYRQAVGGVQKAEALYYIILIPTVCVNEMMHLDDASTFLMRSMGVDAVLAIQQIG